MYEKASHSVQLPRALCGSTLGCLGFPMLWGQGPGEAPLFSSGSQSRLCAFALELRFEDGVQLLSTHLPEVLSLAQVVVSQNISHKGERNKN